MKREECSNQDRKTHHKYLTLTLDFPKMRDVGVGEGFGKASVKIQGLLPRRSLQIYTFYNAFLKFKIDFIA